MRLESAQLRNATAEFQVLDPKVSQKVIDSFLDELEANTAVKASKEA